MTRCRKTTPPNNEADEAGLRMEPRRLTQCYTAMMESNPRNDAHMTWEQWTTLVGICTLAGALCGPPIFIVAEMRHAPWSNVLFYTPFVFVWGAGISLVFASVAAVTGATVILVVRRWLSCAGITTWVAAGVVSGALLGLFHPIVILSAIAEYFAGGRTIRASADMASLTAACGAVAGATAGWWYRARVLGVPSVMTQRERGHTSAV
jgi:hypothetical protein